MKNSGDSGVIFNSWVNHASSGLATYQMQKGANYFQFGFDPWNDYFALAATNSLASSQVFTVPRTTQILDFTYTPTVNSVAVSLYGHSHNNPVQTYTPFV